MEAPITMNARQAISEKIRELAPGSSGDPVQEALEGRRSAILHLLDDRGFLEVRGAAALKLLHGQTTQDVLSLDPGAGAFAFQLNRKARLEAPMVIRALTSNRVLVELPQERMAPTLETFAPFAMLDDCELADVTEDTLALHLSGPHADEVLRRCIEGEFVPELPPHHHQIAGIAGAQVRISPGPETGEKGWRLLVPLASAVDVASRILDEPSVGLGGPDSWTILTMEAGWPEWGRELHHARLVPECNLPEAISGAKGCYVGQEIIARIRTYGKVNRALTGLMSASLLPPGSSLETRDGGDAGMVMSSCHSPHRDTPIALAFVRKESLEPGTRLLAMGEGGPWEVEVSALPFVPRRFWLPAPG